MTDIAMLAARVDHAATKAHAIPQLSIEHEMSMDDAYKVQALSIKLREKRGERIIGMKMGFTSRAKMAQMGLSTMIFGRLTDAMLVEEGNSTPHDRYIHPRVEPEIAFCLKRDLVGRVSLLDAVNAVEWVAPAIEIIDSRYANFKFSLSDVVADNSSSSGFAVGGAVSPRTDIRNLGMVMSLDGVPREIGSSAAILGDPWRSLVAAAAFAGQYEFTLRAGDIVLAGGATGAVAAPPGTRVSLETQNMPDVRFSFTGAKP